MSDRTADLDGGPLINCSSSSNLELDCPLIWIRLNKILIIFGLDLRVTDIFAYMIVTFLLLLELGIINLSI